MDNNDFDLIWNKLILSINYNIVDLIISLKSKFNVYVLSNTNSIHERFFNNLFVKKYNLDKDKQLDSLNLLKKRKNTIILRSFNNFYSIENLELCYIITNKNIASLIKKTQVINKDAYKINKTNLNNINFDLIFLM